LKYKEYGALCVSETEQLAKVVCVKVSEPQY